MDPKQSFVLRGTVETSGWQGGFSCGTSKAFSDEITAETDEEAKKKAHKILEGKKAKGVRLEKVIIIPL